MADLAQKAQQVNLGQLVLLVQLARLDRSVLLDQKVNEEKMEKATKATLVPGVPWVQKGTLVPPA